MCNQLAPTFICPSAVSIEVLNTVQHYLLEDNTVATLLRSLKPILSYHQILLRSNPTPNMTLNLSVKNINLQTI